jgi:hypothetical protein
MAPGTRHELFYSPTSRSSSFVTTDAGTLTPRLLILLGANARDQPASYRQIIDGAA